MRCVVRWPRAADDVGFAICDNIWRQMACPMAGLQWLSRDRNKGARVGGRSTSLYLSRPSAVPPMAAWQPDKPGRSNSCSRSPLRLVRAGLVGVVFSPGLASADTRSCSHYCDRRNNGTEQPASPRAHDDSKTTRTWTVCLRHEGFSRPLCETLAQPRAGQKRARKAANPPRRENVTCKPRGRRVSVW